MAQPDDEYKQRHLWRVTIADGAERQIVMTDADRERTAYHEAGHAITGWFLEYTDPVVKVSIVPRGLAALGYVDDAAYALSKSRSLCGLRSVKSADASMRTLKSSKCRRARQCFHQ